VNAIFGFHSTDEISLATHVYVSYTAHHLKKTAVMEIECKDVNLGTKGHFSIRQINVH
jgi:hypothetical protein